MNCCSPIGGFILLWSKKLLEQKWQMRLGLGTGGNNLGWEGITGGVEC